MELKGEDFKKCEYDVYNLSKDKTCLKTWPELSRFPEYSTHALKNIERDNALRYVFVLYDKKTPLLSEKNLIKRKLIAAEIAGFVKQKDGKFDEVVQAMMKNENNTVNRMAVRFCRGQGMKFSLLVAGMETYYENIFQITNNDKEDDAKDSKEKSELFDKSNKMAEQLEKLAEEIFNDDIDLMNDADEINSEEKLLISSYPEFIAKQKQKEVVD